MFFLHILMPLPAPPLPPPLPVFCFPVSLSGFYCVFRITLSNFFSSFLHSFYYGYFFTAKQIKKGGEKNVCCWYLKIYAIKKTIRDSGFIHGEVLMCQFEKKQKEFYVIIEKNWGRWLNLQEVTWRNQSPNFSLIGYRILHVEFDWHLST